MRNTYISKFDDYVNVYFTNKKVDLPKEYSDEVESYWKSLLLDGKKFFRGDVYTISNIVINSQGLDIFVELTDYAHFLYTLHKNTYTEYDIRIIHTSVLIETSDKKFVFGVMNENTASQNKLQFIGGGIDKNDIIGNKFDLYHNIKKEIKEELGIDTENHQIVSNLRPCYLKSGGHDNFLSAIFKMDLLVDEK